LIEPPRLDLELNEKLEPLDPEDIGSGWKPLLRRFLGSGKKGSFASRQAQTIMISTAFGSPCKD
jgi:hypothetical protein